MKNIILLIMFIVGIFIINIVFYYSSPDYKNFVKRVKTDTQNVQTPSKEDFTIKNNNNSFFSWRVEEKKQEKNTKDDENTAKDSQKSQETTKKDTTVKQEKLWKSYQDILNLFSEYDLKRLEVNANLFDLTNEYPDAYYEFYTPKLTLYFFTTKNYNEVYDIFSVLQYSLPFKINAANNFWDKSFYINFNDDVKDAVRMVILHNWIVFWLKIHKDEYNKVRLKLQNLRNNK